MSSLIETQKVESSLTLHVLPCQIVNNTLNTSYEIQDALNSEPVNLDSADHPDFVQTVNITRMLQEDSELR
jgi:hypothetical protein